MIGMEDSDSHMKGIPESCSSSVIQTAFIGRTVVLDGFRCCRVSRMWMTYCARPFGAALRSLCAFRAGPAFAGMAGVDTANLDTGRAP